MSKAMVLTFAIEDGEITFDVANGDGTNCEALAKLLTKGNDTQEWGTHPEHDPAVVSAGRTTTTE